MALSRHKINRKWLFALIATVLAVLIFFASAATALTLKAVREDTVVYVDGQSVSEVVDSLSAAGVVGHGNTLKFAAKLLRVSGFRPGRYAINTSMSSRQLLTMLKSGSQTPMNLTFNNIRTLPQLAGVVGRQLRADSACFAGVLLNDSLAMGFGFRPETFIGMFIPDTYEVYWTMTPEAFAERMHREYERFWNDDRRARLTRTGLTEMEVATLASIIDEETVKTDEMPRIAGVYINRLRHGMLLQADPTVKYAVGDFTLRRVLNRHLATDSPYNTYMYRGLPPGPIRMPSKAALNAVLNYEEHDYYYFCAREDFSGYHAFARTLAEHSRNARRYSAALDRLGIR